MPPPLPLTTIQIIPLLIFLFSLPCFLSNGVHYPTKNQNPINKNNTVETNMDPFEQETLFKIMESMSSDRNWRVSNPYPCKPGSSWPGLECKTNNRGDTHFHVIRLDFGSPPNTTCKKTATFPAQIFNLPCLESAFFLHCFTFTRTTLEIISSSSSTLQQLSLRSNQALVGPVPPQISSLKSLEILTLSQSQLNGKIPVEIFSLQSLIHLDLSYNSLVGTIPNQMGNLKNLLGLDLSYNSLSGSIPPTIGNLGLLQKLDLSSNALTGIVPETIENLKLLVFLALGNNRLKGKSFPQGITKLVSLQYLLMDGNSMFMSSLPNELGNLVKLQELRLGNSGFSGTIPTSISHLMNLTTLSLENNRLTGEIPAGLSNLSHIYHLNLSRNMLSGVVPFNVGFLKRLGRNLDLSGNPKLCLNASSQILDDKKIASTVNICGSSNGYLIQQPPFNKKAGAAASPSRGFSSLFSFLTLLGILSSIFLV
ncbi:hypothetical protein C5167_037233 [Papaver somniferum]|uniref:Leucine-rich repeat-containing N-terminal plant-type domain-containing protein n=1 Tax=Papaver somniferum TaxID=3469 RepID=A0A4Y7I9G9_PAPSO|nr:receptor like protein 29-like [Papaver somniferum]RZC44281.1 hypothetical protein C5167_037233 [Papaver somniferum]